MSVVCKPNDIWQALRGSISENHPLWRGFQKEDGEHRKNCKIMKHQQKIDGETALKSQFLTLFLVMAIVYNCQEDPRITLCPQISSGTQSISHSITNQGVGIELTGQLQTMMDMMQMLRWC